MTGFSKRIIASLIIAAVVVAGFFISRPHSVFSAIFTGGSHDGSTMFDMSTAPYLGGPYDGHGSAASAEGVLGYGVATKLVFLNVPNATFDMEQFSRQPIVQVQDAYGNPVLTDNSTVVSMTILNNPGAGLLLGTTSMPVVNGTAQFFDLMINRPAQMYTLKATAPGLIPAVSEPFEILVSTEAQSIVVYNYTSGILYIKAWMQGQDRIGELSSGDKAWVKIYRPDGSEELANTHISV